MKRGTPDHPKTLLLAAELKRMGIQMPKTTAVGILESLWQWASRYAIQGDIGRWPDAVIEQAVEWTGEPGTLVAALLRTGWLDEAPMPFRLVIHDIMDHADNVWRQSLTRAGLDWWDGTPARHTSTGRPRALRNSIETLQKSQENRSTTPRVLNVPEPGATRKLYGNSKTTPRKLNENLTQPEPEPEPEPEPSAAYVHSSTPPLPPTSPPPLVEKPVEISPPSDDPSPPLSQSESEQHGTMTAQSLPADPCVAIQVIARRRSMDSSPPASRDGPKDERALAIALVGQMLTAWMERRASALGPPDEALCTRLLELHRWRPQSLHLWLRSLRQRGKHPSTVHSWGWFVHLAEVDLRRPSAAAAGGGD